VIIVVDNERDVIVEEFDSIAKSRGNTLNLSAHLQKRIPEYHITNYMLYKAFRGNMAVNGLIGK
jgi:hypothetical protein